MQISIHYKLYALLLGVLWLGSCKTVQLQGTADQYFTVSLYSKGTGIEQEAKNVVTNTIEKYTKKGYDISYTSVSWGREGEVDFCFQLQKLEPKVYHAFLDELTRLLKDKQVYINEKVPCRESN